MPNTTDSRKAGLKLTPEEQARIEAAGRKVGTAAEFLGLTPEEESEAEALHQLDMARARVGALIANVRKRSKPRLTQARLAERIRTTQSRVAAIEAVDKDVSPDQMVKTGLAAGADMKQIGAALGGAVTG